MNLGVSYSAAIRACKPRSPQLITFRHDHTHRKLFGTVAVNPRGDLVVTQKAVTQTRSLVGCRRSKRGAA
jgi:hypothetical protein